MGCFHFRQQNYIQEKEEHEEEEEEEEEGQIDKFSFVFHQSFIGHVLGYGGLSLYGLLSIMT